MIFWEEQAMRINLKGRPEPMLPEGELRQPPGRPAEAYIGNKTRHAVKCVEQAIELADEACRCFADLAFELRDHKTTLEKFRDKVLDVIGPELPAPESAQLEADIAAAVPATKDDHD
jgi:hypothetical protein